MNLRLDETGFGSLKIFQNPEEFCYGVDAVLLAGFPAEAAAKKRRQCKIMDLGTGIESSNKAKSIARHETTASLDDFVRTASVLLRDKGDFYMVHRPTRLVDICTSCRRHHLEPKELCFVSGKPFEKSNIILIHCTKYGNPELRILDPLFVHNEDGSYSQEILKLYEKLP